MWVSFLVLLGCIVNGLNAADATSVRIESPKQNARLANGTSASLRVTGPITVNENNTITNVTSEATNVKENSSREISPSIRHFIRGRRQRSSSSKNRARPKPKMFAYSKTTSYSASTGNTPKFSSTEQFARLPFDEVQGAESGLDSTFHDHRNERRRSGEHINEKDPQASKRVDCQVMHKPMPDYLHYKGKHGNGSKKPMMTCYICGKRDDPYSNGGYTEECDFSPINGVTELTSGTSDSDSYVGADHRGRGAEQSPYLSTHSSRRNPSKSAKKEDYDQFNSGGAGFYDDFPGFESYGTDSGRYGDDKTAADSTGGGSGCKTVYRGKMKCKICGDSKTGEAFDEQCDYEQDDPQEHHSRAYDNSGGNEKRYRNRPSPYSHGHRNSQPYYEDDYYGSSPTYDDSRYYGDDTGGRRHGISVNSEGGKKQDADGAASSVDKNKNCKVTYKTAPHSPYDSGKNKAKMRCVVCTGGNDGTTEECNYGGSGSSSDLGSSGTDDSPLSSSEDSFHVDDFDNHPGESAESLYNQAFDGFSDAGF